MTESEGRPLARRRKPSRIEEGDARDDVTLVASRPSSPSPSPSATTIDVSTCASMCAHTAGRMERASGSFNTLKTQTRPRRARSLCTSARALPRCGGGDRAKSGRYRMNHRVLSVRTTREISSSEITRSERVKIPWKRSRQCRHSRSQEGKFEFGADFRCTRVNVLIN